MVDYSRFDKISDDIDDELQEEQKDQPIVPKLPTKQMKTPKGKEGRLSFYHEDNLIYEWDQGLEEVSTTLELIISSQSHLMKVNIYIIPPPGFGKRDFDILISHQHLKIGIKGAPPFINVKLLFSNYACNILLGRYRWTDKTF